MDFSGLNSNPVVFDTSANVRPALSLDEEEDAVVDEVALFLRMVAAVPRACCDGRRAGAMWPHAVHVARRSTRWRSLT
jgi:hypothetical protein